MSRQTYGIDLEFRPTTYFWAKEHGIALVSDIKGAQRRRLYAGALESGLTDLIDPDFLSHDLASDQRRLLGRIHPSFMGGEYLPNKREKEVEIARITIASTTQDVTCVYARPVGRRIHYCVVDEYDGDTLDGRAFRTSNKPLNLQQLTDFFLGSWNLLSCLDVNFESHGFPREKVHGFIVDASSSFYAEFETLIRIRVDEWLDQVAPPENPETENTND